VQALDSKILIPEPYQVLSLYRSRRHSRTYLGRDKKTCQEALIMIGAAPTDPVERENLARKA